MTDATLESTERQAIERACEQLSIAYARAIDFRDYDTFVRLFAIDGVMDVGQPIVGREAIAAAVSKRPDELRSRHVLTNHFVEVMDASTARGIAYLSLYRHVGPESLEAGPAPLLGPAAVGHYEDRYVLENDVWRFAKRKLHLAFRKPAASKSTK